MLDTLLDMLASDGVGAKLAVMALVFIPAAALAFIVMAMLQVRGAVRRRAAGISREVLDSPDGDGSLRSSGAKAAQKLIERTTKHYASMDGKNLKMLRQRLTQAGIFDPRAVGFFFLARGFLAVGLGCLAFILVPTFGLKEGLQWPLAGVCGLFGYLAPSLILDRIVASRRQEYRSGFPDMMDLLVVCADAGLGMAAAF